MRFKISIITAIIALTWLCALSSAQHYSVYSTTRGVTVKSGGKTVAATAGMNLKSTDVLNIPDEGKVSILNNLDKRIYTSVRPGQVSVTRLMIEARTEATDKLSGLADKMSVGKPKARSRNRVHSEKGMVKRNADTYCPEECDADSIASQKHPEASDSIPANSSKYQQQ